jgi:hypothetical protein
MKRLMPTGLPGPSSTNSTFGLLEQHGAVRRSSNFTDAAAAHHLLGRDAVAFSAQARMNSTPPPRR